MYIRYKKDRSPCILYLGDSISDDRFVSIDPNLPADSIYKIPGAYKKWPAYITEFLSEHDGIEYTILNGSKSGGTIEFMFDMLMHCIGRYGDRIKYVFAGGTEFHRIYLYDFNNSHTTGALENIDRFSMRGIFFNPMQMQWSLLGGPPKGGLCESKSQWANTLQKAGYREDILEQPALTKHYSDHKIMCEVNYKFGLMRAMRDICIANDIKFHWAQILNIFSSILDNRRFDLEENKKLKDELIKSGQHKLLTKENFMNFVINESRDREYFKRYWVDFPHYPWRAMTPMCPEPFWFGDIFGRKTHRNWVSEVDAHPNEQGQKLLAEKIWKDYEKYKL